MIIRNTTAILAAIFLVTIVTQANAKLNLSTEFCGDRYCGQINHQPDRAFKKAGKLSKTAAHKEIRQKRIHVASIGNAPTSGYSSGLLSQAESYLGQTARQLGVRSTLWCSAFIRKLTNADNVDDRAISWRNKTRSYYGCIGCIAVMYHHVGIVKEYDDKGNPILISGNFNGIVGVGVYKKHRILAYVTP